MIFSFKKWQVFLIFFAIVPGLFTAYVFLSNDTQTKSTKSEIIAAHTTSKEEASQIETNQDDSYIQEVKVIRVVDGDTIELENGQKVRYIGINTPETVDPRKTVECYAQEATQENKRLVEGKIVRLEKDVSETDAYSRLLRYVYLPSNTDNTHTFINDYLVRAGYAYASSYPPDIKYQNQFIEAQQEAQANKLGLWSNCQKNNQAQETSKTENTNECNIKGNISSSGEKIYHVPNQRYYAKTVIDESKGEKWFCTEEEAVNAGWRKSKV